MTRHLAAEYRAKAAEYLASKARMEQQQEQARANGEKKRAEGYNLGIDAMHAAAMKHIALATQVEQEANDE